MSRWIARCVAFAALAASAAGGHAQPQIVPVSPAVECLTPAPQARVPVAYPPERYARKEGATVKVELTFRAPDEAPRMKLLDRADDVSLDMEDAVRAHVKQLRVPCMQAGGAPLVLTQIYDFVPNDGRKVMSSTPADEDARRRGELWKCVDTRSDKVKPRYPDRALWAREDGRVYMQITFAASDQPPVLKTLVATNRHFQTAVERAAETYKMPCFDGGAALTATMLYIFRIEDGKRLLLRDLPLQSLVRQLKSYPKPAYFGFERMGCPFDVRLRYFRPHGPNGIDELETQIPERQPFFEWLSRVELNLTPQQNTAVLGDTMTVSVPCGSLDL
jgi:hypothetical protein